MTEPKTIWVITEEKASHLTKKEYLKRIEEERLNKPEEETEDYVATIELSAKGVQQEHGLSFKDACWVVDKIVESEETHTSLGFSEDHFVNEIKGETDD